MTPPRHGCLWAPVCSLLLGACGPVISAPVGASFSFVDEATRPPGGPGGPSGVSAGLPVRTADAAGGLAGGEAGSAAGGGGAAIGGGPVAPGGVVLAEGEDEARPVAGAWVSSLDGRRVTSDAQGRFSWSGGVPAGGVWLAGAPGHVSSLVSGYAPEGPPTLHLQPLARPVASRPQASPRLVTLTGTVEAPDGGAMQGVSVVVGGAAVETAATAVSDATGSFSLRARVAAAGGEATLIATDPQGRGIGVAPGLTLTGFDQALSPVRVTATTHALEVRVAAVAELPLPVTAVKVVAPDGTAATLVPVAGKLRLADILGVRYDLRIEAQAVDGSAYSLIERPGLMPDWTQPEAVREEVLLAPPAFEPPVPVAIGATLSWSPVPGAVGYTVRLTAPRSEGGWPWEGFSVAPQLALSLPGGELEPGLYRLGVTAWDAPGATARALAQVEGVRALRRVDRKDGLRVAHREVDFTR